MKAVEILDIVGSFLIFFGNRDEADVHNAIFIAIEKFKMDLPLSFRGAGRKGIQSGELWRILREVKPNEKHKEPLHIGNFLSIFTSRELMLMASYLWNEGRSALSETERELALRVLNDMDKLYTLIKRAEEANYENKYCKGSAYYFGVNSTLLECIDLLTGGHSFIDKEGKVHIEVVEGKNGS